MMKKYNITVNGVTYEVTVEEVAMNPAASPRATTGTGHQDTVPATTGAIRTTASSITAPMPGTVLSVDVSVGQEVRNGDKLCTLEAMKMENEITAPRSGVIAAIHTSKGATVNSGDPLFTLR